jgi:hypothetical protein
LKNVHKGRWENFRKLHAIFQEKTIEFGCGGCFERFQFHNCGTMESVGENCICFKLEIFNFMELNHVVPLCKYFKYHPWQDYLIVIIVSP